MDINKIRNLALTEDKKMEVIVGAIGAAQGVEVVEVHNMSGTLSDEDFAKISKDNCLIKAGTQYYHKEFHASTVIRYGAAPRLGNDKIIFDYIAIDKGTKGYELKNETFPSEG